MMISMDFSDLKTWVVLIFSLIPIIGILLAFANRRRTNKGIGKRFIQLVSVILILPIIVVLSIYGVIENQLLGGLLGTIIGYTLSDLAKEDKEDR